MMIEQEAALSLIKNILNLYSTNPKDKNRLLEMAKIQSPEITKQTSTAENPIIEKIKDLLRPFKSQETELKNYSYRINQSVKSFVIELKKRNLIDSDSKKWIYKNILLPTELNNLDYKQIKYESYRKYFY